MIALAALIASVFLGWVAWATWFHATPKIASDMVSFEIVSDHEAVARFGVKRSDDSVVGTCTLQAIAEDHTVVGQLAFQVPDGPAPLKETMTQSLRTERKAVSVDLLGCTADGQPRPR